MNQTIYWTVLGEIVEDERSGIGWTLLGEIVEDERSGIGWTLLGEIVEDERSGIGWTLLGEIVEDERSGIGWTLLGEIVEDERSGIGWTLLGEIVEDERSGIGWTLLGEIVEDERSGIGWTLLGEIVEDERLVLERLSRHIRASIVHQSGSAVVTASTAEWALNKFLYSTVDMAAYQSLARVFSQRCLESGITEVYCNMEAKPGSKVASFLSGVEQGGVVLSEPGRFRPHRPWNLNKPEKPWEVIE
uniref:Uncharacterized protein n=1 Tax=Timema tahoe TaxID=61484 RepID=A0A7R9IFS8_9NEOP|nr:unnamed protein product [Timema tahoe]